MLELIPFSDAHLQCLAGWFSSEREVAQWGGSALSFPLDVGRLRAMIDGPGSVRPDRLCWMAEYGGRLIGHAQLCLDWHNGNAALSRVVVAPDARGRRLAVPMLEQVIAKAFAFPSMERIDLNVFDWNIPAVRTYERLGFIREGLRRSYMRVGDERWDMMLMGLLRADWRQPGAAADKATTIVAPAAPAYSASPAITERVSSMATDQIDSISLSDRS